MGPVGRTAKGERLTFSARVLLTALPLVGMVGMVLGGEPPTRLVDIGFQAMYEPIVVCVLVAGAHELRSIVAN